MALEPVFYPQDEFGYLGKEFYSYDEFSLQEEDKIALIEQCSHDGNSCDTSSSSPELGCPVTVQAPARRKRRRSKREKKNVEDVERQRMTHIAVERNRRKLMNEYLSVMRSLMPPHFVQRGDQASIIGGAINFVKELEHHIHTLEAQKAKTADKHVDIQRKTDEHVQFSGMFNYAQYATGSDERPGQALYGYADIEVTVVENHANLKILSKKRPAQLLKLTSGIQCLGLTVLHLNVTTVHQRVLYSLSVKIEEGSQLSTVDDIACAINQLFGRIEEETASI